MDSLYATCGRHMWKVPLNPVCPQKKSSANSCPMSLRPNPLSGHIARSLAQWCQRARHRSTSRPQESTSASRCTSRFMSQVRFTDNSIPMKSIDFYRCLFVLMTVLIFVVFSFIGRSLLLLRWMWLRLSLMLVSVRHVSVSLNYNFVCACA